MKAYQHILVATNFSEQSDEICQRAKNIADKSDAKLSIVHIIEFSPIIYGGGEFALPLSGDIEESLHENMRKSLAEQAEKFAIPPQHQYLESGTTTATLVELVNRIGADLLIVGSHEQQGIAFLLGSTANSMLHAMPCDILAVHV